MSTCSRVQDLYPGGSEFYSLTFEYLDQLDVRVALFDETTEKWVEKTETTPLILGF